MNIAFVMPNYYEECIGGAEYQAFLLGEELIDRGCKVSYIFISKKNQKSEIDNVFKYSIRKNHIIQKTRLDFIFYFKKIFRILDEINPDRLYLRGRNVFSLIGGYWAIKNNVKVTWHIAHDNDISVNRVKYKSRGIFFYFENLLFDKMIHNFNKIIAQTVHQNTILERNYGINGIVVMNGHPVPDFKNVSNGGEIKILWIANFRPIKRPELFVELARAVGGGIGGGSFYMFGRYDSKKYKKLLEAISSVRNLQLMGEVSNENINMHLNSADLLVNTSAGEGFSNTFIQAWMRGVPVVSLTVDPDQILEREKIGICSSTFDRLVNDTRYLIENKKVRKLMGSRARQFAVQNLSLDNIKRIASLIVS